MSEQTGEDGQPLTGKAKAKAYRQAAYQKAKAQHRVRKAAFAASSAGIEQKEKQKARRKAAYKQSKTTQDERKAAERESQAREQELAAATEAAARELELQQQLTTADRLESRGRHLRLVP